MFDATYAGRRVTGAAAGERLQRDQRLHACTDMTERAYLKRTSCNSRCAITLASIKGKRSPYSLTERSVPKLIPVLGSQPASDVSHKPGGRLPLLSARPAVTLATLKRGLLPILLLGEQRHDGCEQFA